MTQYNGTDDESKVFKPEMLCDVSDEDRFTMILKDKELNWYQKVVAMVFSDYLYGRILVNKFLSFDNGVNISNKINKII